MPPGSFNFYKSIAFGIAGGVVLFILNIKILHFQIFANLKKIGGLKIAKGIL